MNSGSTRSLSERVKAGLETARAKGKRLGRPRVVVDARGIAALRKSGASWATICNETGLSKGTAQRAFHSLPRNPAEPLLIHFPIEQCRQAPVP